jgi:hypothetical protein
VLSAGIKGLRREADHSIPKRVEVKNTWSYTYTPPYALIPWYVVKQRDNFIFIDITTLCCSYKENIILTI